MVVKYLLCLYAIQSCSYIGATGGCSILNSQCDLLVWDVGSLLAVGLVAEWPVSS